MARPSAGFRPLIVALALALCLAVPVWAQSEAGAEAESAAEVLLTRRSSAAAAGLDDPSLDMVDSARVAMIHMRLPAAERTLYGLMAEGGAAAHVAGHQLMTIAVLRVLFHDRPSDYDRFFEVSDSLRMAVPDDESNALASWIRADNELQRSWVWAKKDQNVRAALAANAAWVGMKSVLEHHPKMFDAYLGMGVLHVGLGALPKSYRRFLRILGYGGTLQEGIHELTLAADSSAWMGIQARFFLAVLDLYGYPSTLEAVPTLESLHEAAPDSPLFALLLADAYLRENRAPDAERVLAGAQAINQMEDVESVDYVDFFHAEALFRMGRCQDAAPLFGRYLEQHPGPALKARTNLSLGLCLELAGERDRAMEYYSRVVAARAFDEDAAASRRARQLLDHPMGAVDVLLLRADQAFQSSRPDSAAGLYRSVFESAEATPAERGAALYGLGRSSHAWGALEEALAWYALAISQPGDPRAKWAPWSLFHTAEIRESMGQIGAAISMLDRLMAYPEEYDFRPTLENRARIWREELVAR